MPRLLFEKTGNAVWISHLDLMRLFQRAFKRAGLPLTHTQGFNPRPAVSIALPLSVGVESHCELLDFNLDTETIPNAEICERLNRALINGVRVLQVYDTGRKLRELALMRCDINLVYDNDVPIGAGETITNLFASDLLTVPKKTKNGLQEQNIIPMIRRITARPYTQKELVIEAVICCQNPSLNPMQLTTAIERYLPELKPDASNCRRMELYDAQETIFR